MDVYYGPLQSFQIHWMALHVGVWSSLCLQCFLLYKVYERESADYNIFLQRAESFGVHVDNATMVEAAQRLTRWLSHNTT